MAETDSSRKPGGVFYSNINSRHILLRNHFAQVYATDEYAV
jgi:hypothetical protein